MPLTLFPRFYPIGTPGQPWSAADISEWRAQQVRRRSHADDVVMPLQRLADRLTLVPYGELVYGAERYPLLAARPVPWRSALPAVLVTGGGLAQDDERVDALAGAMGAMGLAVTKAAQHKLVGVLGARLAKDGIFVGEVMVTALVKGSAPDRGQPTVEPAVVAARFWDLYTQRGPRCAKVP